MTLKEYLEGAGLNITPDQRSQLGILISKQEDHFRRVLEGRWNVKDYYLKHLKSDETHNIIMNFLNSIQNG
jgi:dsDNA-binding SOS-regulon protein